MSARRVNQWDTIEAGKQVQSVIPQEHYDALNVVAKRLRKPVAAVVRMAVAHYVDVVRA